MEDACTVHDTGLLLAIFFSREPALIFGLVLVLPVTTLEALDVFGDVLEILFIKEMGTERATTVHQLR